MKKIILILAAALAILASLALLIIVPELAMTNLWSGKPIFEYG